VPCSSLVKHFPCEKWPALVSEFSKAYMTKDLCPFLEAAWNVGRAHPPREDVFKAFHLTALDDVSVVIVGKDPYPDPRHAMGLAFSVPTTIRKLPRSLRRIYRELEGDRQVRVPPKEGRGDLSSWADQGTLLLNCALTRGATSHVRWWRTFTDKAIEVLDERDEPVVFLFWGREAWRKAPLVRAPQHFVRCAAHPDPRSGGFMGCRHFSQTNTFLMARGLSSINWGCVSDQGPTRSPVQELESQ